MVTAAKSLAERKQESAVPVHPRFMRWNTFSWSAKMFGPARGHYLTVGIMRHGPKSYAVLAIQGPGDKDSPQAFLQNHAHAIVSESEPTRAAARRAAEKFAKRWMRSPDLDECGCKEIGS